MSCRKVLSWYEFSLSIIPSIKPALKTPWASYMALWLARHSADSAQEVGRWLNRSAICLWASSKMLTLTYRSSAYGRASGISKPCRAATASPANNKYTSADPSGQRNSMVCLVLRSAWPACSRGLASVIISLAPCVQPRGTRTSTERLRSPQQILVGASWCGTRRK